MPARPPSAHLRHSSSRRSHCWRGGPAAFVAFPLAGFIAGGAAVGVVVGTAAAAQAIVPEEQALAIEQMATSAVARLRLPDLTAAAIATGVKNLAARDAHVIDDEGASRLDGYRSLRERGFGTVIEIRITEIGFSGPGADTIMALFLTAEAQLVDTASGKPVMARGLVHLSPQHRFGVWAQDGAALTTAEIDIDLTPRGCLDFMPAPNLFRFRTP